MFGFKKKEKKPLLIRTKDVFQIIKSDYDDDSAFTLIEFICDNQHYLMGSCVHPPDAEERKENIIFIFQDNVYRTFEEFERMSYIGDTKVSELEKPVEIVRAGIIGNDTLLKTPWGDKRLADRAVNKDS